jgi:hypothetical protein
MHRGKQRTVVLCTFLQRWTTVLTVHATDVLVVLSVNESHDCLEWKEVLPITSAQAGPSTVVTSDNSTRLDLPNRVLHFHSSPGSTQHDLLEPLELMKAINSGTLSGSNGTSIRTFEWLLWGTSTTLVLWDNLQALLQPFDSKLPYVITDHTYRNGVPYPGSACLPCHWGRSRSHPVQGTAAQMMPAGGC